MCIPHFMIESIQNEENPSQPCVRCTSVHCTLLLFVNKFTPQISSILNSFMSGLDRIKFCNEQLRRHENERQNDRTSTIYESIK